MNLTQNQKELLMALGMHRWFNMALHIAGIEAVETIGRGSYLRSTPEAHADLKALEAHGLAEVRRFEWMDRSPRYKGPGYTGYVELTEAGTKLFHVRVAKTLAAGDWS